MFVDIFLGGYEHAAGTGARVVDPHPLLGVDEADHHPNDGTRGVELSALLAGGVGKVADKVLVGCAQQVGKLEVLVAQQAERLAARSVRIDDRRDAVIGRDRQKLRLELVAGADIDQFILPLIGQANRDTDEIIKEDQFANMMENSPRILSEANAPDLIRLPSLTDLVANEPNAYRYSCSSLNCCLRSASRSR